MAPSSVLPTTSVALRVIVRFSVSGETNGALRNKLSNVLTTAGLTQGQNTATYEGSGIKPTTLGVATAEFWNAVAYHQGPGIIDHFWMYADG
jgi:hypothetical protein